MVSRSVQVEDRGGHRRVARLLTSTAVSGAFAAIVAAFPQGALAACLGENTANVLCDAANPATGGKLNEPAYTGDLTVTINAGSQIVGSLIQNDPGVRVGASGNLTVINNDAAMTGGFSLGGEFGLLSFVGNVANDGIYAVGGADSVISIVQNGTSRGGIIAKIDILPGQGTSTPAGTDGIVITNNGNVTAYGISAAITENAVSNITINQAGTVSGGGGTAGIYGLNAGTGDVTINASGAINAAGGIGIGIEGATRGGNVTIVNSAIITAPNSAGIYGSSLSGNVSITQSGAINAAGGIDATSQTGNVDVTASGAITAQNVGIYALVSDRAGNASSNVNSQGNITMSAGATAGILVDNESSGNASVTLGAGATISGAVYGISSATYGFSTVTLGAGASISATQFGIMTTGRTGAAITIGEGASVIATPTVQIPGSFGIGTGAGGVALYNAGTISGVTAAIAFQSTGAINTLTLAPTSVISGLVVGGASPFQVSMLGSAIGAADTLQLGGAGTGTFDVSQLGDTAQYSGFGTFNKIDSSIWVLTGTPGQTTSWSINGGELSVANDISLGAANEALSFNGGLLQVTGTGFTSTLRALNWGAGGGGFDIADPANVFTVSQALGAGGALTKLGAGTLILSGANSYSGTIVDAGTLRIAGAGTLGDIGGVLTMNGGMLDLGGTTQTQNGGVTLTGGTISNGTLSSSGVFDVQSGTIATLLAGTGSLVKNSAGEVFLNGLNTYTGATTINAGTLSVNGDITASSGVTVNAGGTLGGNGILSSTQINGGTLSPGNSIGLLTISGSLTMTAASTYLVQISGTASDRTVVTGIATIGGKVTVDPLTRLGQTTTYTILNAGTLSGTFDSTTLTNNFARNARLSYVGNDVLLTLDPGLLSPILPGNASGNQKNAAGAIDNALIGGASLPSGFNALFNLSGNALLTALSQASGETGTGAQQATFDAMNLFMGVLTDPFTAGRSVDAPNAMGYAEEGTLGYAATRKPSDAFAMLTKAPPRAFEASWNVWGAGYGGSQTTNGNATLGSNTATSSIGGFAVGADYWMAPNTVAGFALAGGGTTFSVAGGGSGRSDLFQAGAFVRHSEGSAYITAALAYGWQDITTDRTVTISGIDRLHAEYNANSYSARVEGGNRYVVPYAGGIGITLYAAAQVTAFDLPSYGETTDGGVGTFGLNYAAKTVMATRSELGFRSDKSFAISHAILTLRSRAAWAHDYNTDRSATATFQTLPGSSFIVSGAATAHDAALTTASAEMKFVSGISLAATFEGEFSDVTTSYAGKGVVRYQW